jgi:hypothetical protein
MRALYPRLRLQELYSKTCRTGMPHGIPKRAMCVERFDDSLNSAIHTTYLISRRSSSYNSTQNYDNSRPMYSGPPSQPGSYNPQPEATPPGAVQQDISYNSTQNYDNSRPMYSVPTTPATTPPGAVQQGISYSSTQNYDNSTRNYDNSGPMYSGPPS